MRRAVIAPIAISLALGAFAGHAQTQSAHAAGAQFTAGAAVQSYTPYCGPDGTPAANNCVEPPAGFTDPASSCAQAVAAATSGQYTGRRLFAFEELYIDQMASGHYDYGDPFIDCNNDGRWDGNFLGGGSNAPRYYDYVADQVGARALVVGNGTRTIAVEVLDHEGAFDVFLAAIRADVAAMLPAGASLNANDIFI
ncbi:MAG: hypothetical protein JOY80_11380 [Candidatus Dormibacteraeota bacterium]|nr:hypothetical protein [Candidatus Dormibacteraeota bacterium]